MNAVGMVLVLLWAMSGLAVVEAITRTERGALKLLFWATDGRNWARTWDIQNPRGDPCLDNVRGLHSTVLFKHHTNC